MPEHNTIPVTVIHRSGGYTFKTYFNLNEIPSDTNGLKEDYTTEDKGDE